METTARAIAPDPTHPKPLLGRVAVVTGSSRGIGAAIARELAASGATIVVNYVSGAEAAAGVVAQIEAAGGSALAECGNVSNFEDVCAMFERVKAKTGRLDVVVNNAGILRDRTFKKMSIQDWHEVIDTNLTSVMNCCHCAVPLLLENGWGRIINISSFVGQMGNFGQANYSAAKAGILGFTKSLAIELARYNITVNAVCPGLRRNRDVALGAAQHSRENFRPHPDAPGREAGGNRARRAFPRRRGRLHDGPVVEHQRRDLHGMVTPGR